MVVGTFKVSKVFRLTANKHDYCPPNGLLENDVECVCGKTEEGLKAMDIASDAYNKQLEKIVSKYAGKPGGTFAVMYSPAPIDALTFPIDAIRYICQKTLRDAFNTFQLVILTASIPV